MKTIDKQPKPVKLKKRDHSYKTLDDVSTAKVKQVEQLLANVDWNTFKRPD